MTSKLEDIGSLITSTGNKFINDSVKGLKNGINKAQESLENKTICNWVLVWDIVKENGLTDLNGYHYHTDCGYNISGDSVMDVTLENFKTCPICMRRIRVKKN